MRGGPLFAAIHRPRALAESSFRVIQLNAPRLFARQLVRRQAARLVVVRFVHLVVLAHGFPTLNRSSAPTPPTSASRSSFSTNRIRAPFCCALATSSFAGSPTRSC